MVSLTQNRLLALYYSDIFDYPLTKEELRTYSISSSLVRFSSHIAPNAVQQRDTYFFINGRNRLVHLRKKREQYTKQKLYFAHKWSKYFRIVPTIKMIAVTGAVAAGNAKQNDDIDLMIVTSSGFVWTTRLLVIVIAELFRIRRRPNDTRFLNKLCLNMFIDENHLTIPKHEQDVFSANEIARVRVLWSRGDVEVNFWNNNKWIKNFLPNVVVQLRPEDDQPVADAGHSKITNRTITKKVHQGGPLQIVESILRSMQLAYMKNRRTSEVISNGYLRFHPHDARIWILREYKKRLSTYGIVI